MLGENMVSERADLAYEVQRNRELLESYKALGVEGAIGVDFIQKDIDFGRAALKSGDSDKIKTAYNRLKNNT